MILIVGGGPAGSLSAMLLGKENEVLLVEEHQSPGFPVQCAGLISDKCFESYKRYCKIEKALENRIKGALFFSPSGEFFFAKGDAFVIERKILDEMLFEKASEFSEVFIKSKLKFKGRKAMLNGKEVSAEYIIGADGLNSEVAKVYGFERPHFMTAVQIETKFEALDQSFVEIYLGKAYSEFFAYAIPLGDTARIGVIAKENAMQFLRNLLEKHPSVSKRIKGSIIELNSGMIPLKLVDFVKENVALIGDSAGMVKPHTGGGLYYLLLAAEKLAKNFPNLYSYQRDFLRELGREIKLGERIRRIYSLEDPEIEKIIKALKNFNFSGVHMDRPSTFLNPIVFFRILNTITRHPSLIKTAFKVLIL
ncbi:MAG: NAD(P)/FAD-dependent oxidoreductase [Archaeoglobaceae archaeon]|nr:NAD(P)/FAD-dependent oxidoreductase [Archaeoglobaceae archaeon]MDW8117984.1 NAD(P)/FAD-dependent oxidoreductase [Archaeoglobaceae archaeon]